jgi:hypothetical protein
MKSNRLIALALFTTVISITGQTQTTPIESRPPIEVVKHKIGTDYYPMLDRPSLTTGSMTAENGDMPMSENERLARQRTRNSNNKVASAPIAPGDTRSRGRLRSYTRIIDTAELVQVELKNTEAKPIKAVDWDFAFPRYENGQLLLRFDVASKIEIKPGGKKTLKYHLPPGAKKCEVVKVISDENQPEKVTTFEAVCGAGFHDLSLLKQRQETISIKRIEYADGTIWQR